LTLAHFLPHNFLMELLTPRLLSFSRSLHVFVDCVQLCLSGY
jgi:hypothetical protein